MKHFKRILCMVLLVCLCLSLAQLSALAASSTVKYKVTGGYIYFNKSTKTVTSCDNSVTKAVIPSKISSIPVTGIADYAFEGCQELVSVGIPKTVTSIGESAFDGCASLKSIPLPSSITRIGEYAFAGCNGLKTIAIPGSVTSIGAGAFDGCENLVSITIPSSVTSMGNNPLSDCPMLKTIKVASANPKLQSIDGVLFNKKATRILAYPAGKAGSSYTLPKSVTSIGVSAFYNSQNLKSIRISNRVTNIGDYAFASCNGLKSIAIPSSVTSIGDFAFAYCNGLKSIAIPNGVTSIGDSAFDGCESLVSITIPSSVTSVDGNPLSDCPKLTTIKVASANPKLRSIDGVLFNKKATRILAYPAGKAGSSYTLPKSVTSIGDSAFFNSQNLKSISMSNRVTNIGEHAFASCNGLKSIIIPSSVTSIGDSSFAYCNSLKSITLPRGIKSIGQGAFDGAPLASVYYAGTKSQWNAIKIDDYNNVLSKATIRYQTAPVTKITLSHSAITVLVDGSYTLKATLTPNYTTDTVKWTSSDKSIATVSRKGVVTGKAPGTATITAQAGSKKITCKVTVKKLKPPASVKTVSAGYNSVKLTWKKSTGAAGYQIYRSTSKNGTYQRIATIDKGSTVTYTDSKAVTGQIYYYKIRAFQTVGSAVKRSGYTAPVSGRALLSKPKSLAAAKASATSVKTSWKQVPGASGYQLQMSTKPNSGFTTIKTIKSGKTLSYTATKLKKGTTYYFRIRAYRTVNGKNVYSGWSAVAKGKL